MSTKELTFNLIDSLDDNQIQLVFNFVRFLKSEYSEIPNSETISAINEIEDMQENRSGQHFAGSTEDFMKMMLSE